MDVTQILGMFVYFVVVAAISIVMGVRLRVVPSSPALGHAQRVPRPPSHAPRLPRQLSHAPRLPRQLSQAPRLPRPLSHAPSHSCSSALALSRSAAVPVSGSPALPLSGSRGHAPRRRAKKLSRGVWSPAMSSSETSTSKPHPSSRRTHVLSLNSPNTCRSWKLFTEPSLPRTKKL